MAAAAGLEPATIPRGHQRASRPFVRRLSPVALQLSHCGNLENCETYSSKNTSSNCTSWRIKAKAWQPG